jgi:hypothetical protein
MIAIRIEVDGEIHDYDCYRTNSDSFHSAEPSFGTLDLHLSNNDFSFFKNIYISNKPIKYTRYRGGYGSNRVLYIISRCFIKSIVHREMSEYRITLKKIRFVRVKIPELTEEELLNI